MIWQEISIRVPQEFVEPISYLFGRYGYGLAMEPDDSGQVLLRTYLPSTSQQRLARIEVGVRLVSAIAPVGGLEITPLPEEQDWQNAWKEHFGLLRVGQRMVIKPSWIEYQPEPDEVMVELDPGIAFGTGYHPTTYTCLEALEQTVRPAMAVLDLGTGSGILTIAAIKLGAGRVVALDIDPQAVRAARQNFRRARIQQQVTLAQGTVPHPLAQSGQFDLVLANISARAVNERAPFILPTLGPQGLFVASGLMNNQRQEVHDTLTGLGFAFVREWSRDEWVSLAYRPGSR